VGDFDPIRYKAATSVFKLANKTLESGMHRTLDREPKGKGWVECGAVLQGLKCKPVKVLEAIEYFRIAYEIFPDIVALNQIALAYETLGETQMAIGFYQKMKEQARLESNEPYLQVAELGLARCG
jgi:tetratricopeptide (TPR) repeat protein